jgi:glycosyltransferase involved in cell wall biosynthesis
MSKVPVLISTVHDMNHWSHKRSRIRTDRVLLGWRDAVFCVSKAARRVYMKETGCAPHKCRNMPNGLDISRFSEHRPRAEILGELGIGEDQKIVGIVANLVPIKNYEGFLDIAARIRSEKDDVAFVIVGEGPLRGELESRAESMGLSSNVYFLGQRRDIPDLLSIMNCFLLPSFREAFPISVLESLAAGVPVVATNVGGPGEIIHPGQEGFLADPEDTDDMAKHVLKILGDPELARTLGENGRRRVTAFEIERVAERTATVYRELLDAKR